MNKTRSIWIKRCLAFGAALIGLGGFALALAGGERRTPPVHYEGLINDYTPSAAVVGGGPYEMRGKWSMDVDEFRGTATFYASMNMETSDYGITQGSVDKDNPTSRGAHTHHINVTDGVVSNDWSKCPPFKPAITQGFTVTGTAYITGNGSPAPFGNPSPITVCVLGGTNVTYSNMTFAFGTPASGHFGTQAIHGVVVRCVGPRDRELDECTLDE